VNLNCGSVCAYEVSFAGQLVACRLEVGKQCFPQASDEIVVLSSLCAFSCVVSVWLPCSYLM